jgi:hypothetical protein
MTTQRSGIVPREHDDKTYYSVKELSETFAASEEFIKKQMAEGRIEGREIDGEWFISEDALQRFFEGD